MKEDNNDAAARKAKRQKMLAERRELKAVVDEKRARRMQLEEEVKYLEDVRFFFSFYSFRTNN